MIEVKTEEVRLYLVLHSSAVLGILVSLAFAMYRATSTQRMLRFSPMSSL